MRSDNSCGRSRLGAANPLGNRRLLGLVLPAGILAGMVYPSLIHSLTLQGMARSEAIAGPPALLYRGARHCLPYGGSPLPGRTPVVFWPGVVSTEEAWEFSITFSPDGEEFYFTRRRGSGGDSKHRDGRNTILVSRCEGASWTSPEVASFSGQYPDHEPYITLDGTSLFWGSNRPLPSGRQNYRIWKLPKIEDGWGEPELAPIEGMYITATAGGTLYTSGIERYERDGGSYGEPISVGIRGSHPFIAPDESFMLFDRERRIEGDIHSFMFITNRDEEGNWSEPIELPGELNRGICPMVTPDGKYLFFSVDGDLHWVEVEVLDPFRIH